MMPNHFFVICASYIRTTKKGKIISRARYNCMLGQLWPAGLESDTCFSAFLFFFMCFRKSSRIVYAQGTHAKWKGVSSYLSLKKIKTEKITMP